MLSKRAQTETGRPIRAAALLDHPDHIEIICSVSYNS